MCACRQRNVELSFQPFYVLVGRSRLGVIGVKPTGGEVASLARDAGVYCKGGLVKVREGVFGHLFFISVALTVRVALKQIWYTNVTSSAPAVRVRQIGASAAVQTYFMRASDSRVLKRLPLVIPGGRGPGLGGCF